MSRLPSNSERNIGYRPPGLRVAENGDRFPNLQAADDLLSEVSRRRRFVEHREQLRHPRGGGLEEPPPQAAGVGLQPLPAQVGCRSINSIDFS